MGVVAVPSGGNKLPDTLKFNASENSATSNGIGSITIPLDVIKVFNSYTVSVVNGVLTNHKVGGVNQSDLSSGTLLKTGNHQWVWYSRTANVESYLAVTLSK